MTFMTERAIDIVGNNSFNASFDKGYYTAEQIHNTQQLGITTHVCILSLASNAPEKSYNFSEFKYNPRDDTYQCPEGNILKTNGN